MLYVSLLATARADDDLQCTVTNHRADSVKVTVWTSEPEVLAPFDPKPNAPNAGTAHSFKYARLSNLPVEVFKTDGTKIFTGKISVLKTWDDFSIELKADGSVVVHHGSAADELNNDIGIKP